MVRPNPGACLPSQQRPDLLLTPVLVSSLSLSSRVWRTSGLRNGRVLSLSRWTNSLSLSLSVDYVSDASIGVPYCTLQQWLPAKPASNGVQRSPMGNLGRGETTLSDCGSALLATPYFFLFMIICNYSASLSSCRMRLRLLCHITPLQPPRHCKGRCVPTTPRFPCRAADLTPLQRQSFCLLSQRRSSCRISR